MLTGVALYVPYLHAPGGRTQRLPIDWTQQVYEFTPEGRATLYFDVERLYHLIDQRKPPFDTVEARWMAVVRETKDHMLRFNGLEREHLERIRRDRERIEQPGIICAFEDDGQIVVDGSHRYVARYLLRRKTMLFWWLEPEQWRLALLDATQGTILTTQFGKV